MLFIASNTGCAISSTPKEDTGFANAKDIQSLAGCYRNKGEGKDKKPRFLSAEIWPGDDLAHTQIKAINVVYVKPRTLRVIALGDNKIIKESIFVEGKDFHLSSGRINIKSDTVVSYAYPAGNVFIGVGHGSKALGIDANGDARMQESSTFAGTAFLVIPVAGNVQDAFRFPKEPELCEKH